ncbi:hypothetical protein M0813_03393 [Anaeramoeba flamelloides]|uniref:B box-type domain-containing protein n=1 Tax=Anaeramoeba flamelloides TaxID=1746091 RepID=A0ABQ8XWQ2_9EUKA|nr:hypothetical protein M0813_03393 [Anaeramoeba flamelloides]
MTTSFPIEVKIENSVQTEEIIWCDVCLEDNKKVAAKVYCQDCGENQCKQCDVIHQSRRFSKHVRTDLHQNSDNNITEKCPSHQNNQLSRFCKNCQKLICSECVFEHSNHETISFDQSMDFYKELINEQKQCIQNHLKRINKKFEEINNSEKEMKSNKENILKEISEFYSNQKKLLELLEQNEIKLTKDFFEEISITMKIEKQMINNSKYSTENLLEHFLELEKNIKQSNSFGFFKLFSQIELTKTQENLNSQFSRLCNEHKNQPYKYFCIDHKQLLCTDCLTLNHRKCNQVLNLKEGYEKIQNELEKLIKGINSINMKKLVFVQKIQNEKLNCLKEKKINIKLIKNNYQKLNKLTQHQFKNMNKEISIQQNKKYFKLNKQSKKIQKEFDIFAESEMIIKEIAICKNNNDYQQILINFFKLKKLLPILNKKNDNKLICDSKFDKINFISNDLKQNLKNWKLNLSFNLNKTQISLPDEIQLENKFQFSILLKNKFNGTVNAQEFNLKVEIFKSNSNEMITEITKFQEGTNQESIGEYLFQKEGEYQINFSINGQKIPKSPFNLKVIDLIFLEESEILQNENNPKFKKNLEKWIKEAGCNSNLRRRFNSRKDGWGYQTFHQKCDNKGKSIILIKLKNKSLFGGFAAIDWNSTTSEWKQSKGNKSFLFSLISLDPNFKEPLKMPLYQNHKYEILCSQNYGPYFGYDLSLGSRSQKMNKNKSTYSELGHTYKPPFGYKCRSEQARNFLAGSFDNWDISQIEIFCEN